MLFYVHEIFLAFDFWWLLWMLSACFRVFYWKNTSISFWASRNFPCMELQVLRYSILINPHVFVFNYIFFFEKKSCFKLCCIVLFVHWSIFVYVTATLDIEFGRIQARDMLQHLWTGPISNASVDVVQGSRSVEVRAVGVTKVCELWYADLSWMFHVNDITG